MRGKEYMVTVVDAFVRNRVPKPPSSDTLKAPVALNPTKPQIAELALSTAAGVLKALSNTQYMLDPDAPLRAKSKLLPVTVSCVATACGIRVGKTLESVGSGTAVTGRPEYAVKSESQFATAIVTSDGATGAQTHNTTDEATNVAA